MKRRLLAFLLMLAMVCTMLPVQALAATMDKLVPFEETVTYINPLYADVVTEADLVEPQHTLEPHADGDPVYASTFAEAGEQMREPMVNREQTIVVYYQTANFDSSQAKDIFHAAVAHTGNSDEGDALRWVYAGYKADIKRSVKNGISYVTFTYTMTYYTTAEQEVELEKAMDALLATVDPEATDYERFCTVYDYICANISYDYDNLYDDDYKLKYTAYAALVNGTAVCQGYAVLLYQLALELGIDCRVITGIGNAGGHGWNIVKFGDFYYNTDPTWDSIWYQALGYYNYFLQNEVTFTSNYTDHYRDAEYDTTEFHALYPISETNYMPEVDIDSDYIGDGLTWEMDDEGVLLISGIGEMIDYDFPWNEWRDEITYVVIDAGVTRIGAGAFKGLENLEAVVFMGNAPEFGGDDVFEGTFGFVFYPAGNPTWTEDVMQAYGGVPYWYPMCLEHEWGEWLVAAEPTCEENGVKDRTCALCGEYEEELIPAIGHNYILSVVDATCTQQGYTEHTCTNCGDSFTDGYIDALGHDWSNWVVAGEPTCEDNGANERTCARCGEYEEELIPAIGHNYILSVVDATCTEQGYTEHTCTNCGDSFTDGYVDALGHDYETGVCNRCGGEDPDYVEPLEITTQPTDYVGALKSNASFTVAVNKDDVTYQWYYSTDGVNWLKSSSTGCNTNTLTVQMLSYRLNQMYRCVITDAEGSEVASNAVKMILPESTIEIITQPADFYGAVAEVAPLTVEATGEGLTYRWYYSNNGGEGWSESWSEGYNTPTLSPVLREYNSGRMFKCLITDVNGNTEWTDVVTVSVACSDIVIKSQPVSYLGALNDLAHFTVEAEGVNLTYRWQFSTDGGETWANSENEGYSTPTLNVRLYGYRDGYMYKCIIRSGVDVQTETAAVSINKRPATVQITSQPLNSGAPIGSEVTFRVGATGSGLNYQWQYSTDGGENWGDSGMTGAKTDALTVKVIAGRNGQMYRCAITDDSGVTVYSNIVILRVGNAPVIVGQPQSYTGAVGTMAVFTVEATGDDLTYQWQYSNNGGATWSDSGSTGCNTASLSVEAKAYRSGQMYRCIITNEIGTAISEAATLTVQ